MGKACNKVVGFDANALYLWCIGQPQLCGNLKYIPFSDSMSQDMIIKEILTNENAFGALE